jgi:hypothetical protein
MPKNKIKIKNVSGSETNLQKRKEREPMEMDVDLVDNEYKTEMEMEMERELEKEWDEEISGMMIEPSCKASASASASSREPGMKKAFDSNTIAKSASEIREQQNRINAEEQRKDLKFLEENVKIGVDINNSNSNGNSNSNSNSNVLQSALRPVKNVSQDLLQIPIHPFSFRARVNYVKKKIIPLELAVCVPTTFFIMTGKMNTTQLGKLINYKKFQDRGMFLVEIGKLIELLGYRQTNEEYKLSDDVILPDIVANSGRYYRKDQCNLFIEQIKSTLRVNHVTPILFIRAGGKMGHAVCIVNFNGKVFIIDTSIEDDIIPIDNLEKYMDLDGNNFVSAQIFYGASVEDKNIVLQPKREASGRVVGIGPAISSNKEVGPVRIRKDKDGEKNPRKRSRTEGGRKYTRRRHKGKNPKTRKTTPIYKD